MNIKRQYLIDILEKQLKAEYIGKEHEGKQILDVIVYVDRDFSQGTTGIYPPVNTDYETISVVFEVHDNNTGENYRVKADLED